MTPQQAQALRKAEWMPGTPATEWADVREQICTMIRSHPRSLQVEPGPSELGTTCLRCLAHRLNGEHKLEDPAAQWAPTVGTGGHLLLQHWFDCHPGDRMVDLDGQKTPIGDRWTAEMPVVTALLHHHGRPVEIGGHIDLWDAQELATVDWKFVGQSTLKTVMRHGPSQAYRVQASLYGIGVHNTLGLYPVKSCIYYLPRSARNLDEGYAYEAWYDPRPGEWALRRAQQVYDLLDLADDYQCTREAIARLPCAGDDCFTCTSHAYEPPRPAGTLPTFGDLLNGNTTETPPDGSQNDRQREPLPEGVQDLIDGLQAVYTPNNIANTIN